MKKVFKKMVALLCGAVLAVAAAGCGTTDADTPSSSSTQESLATDSSESQEETAGTQTISVWCWSPNEDLLQRGVEMYNELGNDVALDVTVMALADVRTKIATIAGSGDYSQLPDVILMQDTSIPMLIKAYPEAFSSLDGYNINTEDYDQAKIG